MDYDIVTGRDRDDFQALQSHVIDAAWPEFMLHDAAVGRYWSTIKERYPEYQFVLLEKTGGRVVAVGNAMPLAWQGENSELSDEGLDWALEHCWQSLGSTDVFHTLCAFQIIVPAELAGRHLSYDAVRAMIDIGRKNGLEKLVAPVRPNRKSECPQVTMDEYVRRKNDEGLPADPWMRVHTRLGAETAKVCPRSMLIESTVDEWRRWTGMTFDRSGEYTVPGALVPVTIDIERDRGTYIEPNVWMVHTL